MAHRRTNLASVYRCLPDEVHSRFSIFKSVPGFTEETTIDSFSLTFVRCWCYSRCVRVFKYVLSSYFAQAWRL